jgi:hypothetical protein
MQRFLSYRGQQVLATLIIFLALQCLVGGVLVHGPTTKGAGMLCIFTVAGLLALLAIVMNWIPLTPSDLMEAAEREVERSRRARAEIIIEEDIVIAFHEMTTPKKIAYLLALVLGSGCFMVGVVDTEVGFLPITSFPVTGRESMPILPEVTQVLLMLGGVLIVLVGTLMFRTRVVETINRAARRVMRFTPDGKTIH